MIAFVLFAFEISNVVLNIEFIRYKHFAKKSSPLEISNYLEISRTKLLNYRRL